MYSGKDNHGRKNKSRSRPTNYNSVVFSFLSSNHPMYTFSLYFSDHFPFVLCYIHTTFIDIEDLHRSTKEIQTSINSSQLSKKVFNGFRIDRLALAYESAFGVRRVRFGCRDLKASNHLCPAVQFWKGCLMPLSSAI